MKKISNQTHTLFIVPGFLILILILLFAIQNNSAMSRHKNGYKYLIGLSLPNSTTSGNGDLINLSIKQKSDSRDMNIIVKEARDNSSQQTEDINELLSYGIDLLIIYPLYNEALEQKLNSMEIPIIVLNEKKLSKSGTAFIKYDNTEPKKKLIEPPDMYKAMTETAILILNNKTYNREITLRTDSINKTEMSK